MKLTAISNGKLEIALAATYRRQPVDATAAHALRECERQFTEALVEILDRAQRLLDLLDDPDTAWEAVANATMGAGASGPIGSQWEKALAAAVRAKVLGEYATEER